MCKIVLEKAIYDIPKASVVPTQHPVKVHLLKRTVIDACRVQLLGDIAIKTN